MNEVLSDLSGYRGIILKILYRLGYNLCRVRDQEEDCSVYRGRSRSKDLMEKKRREISDD